MNEELKLLWKCEKNRGAGVRSCRGWRGARGVGLVEGEVVGWLVAMLGKGDVGYGGCEARIEGIVQCTKRYCTILRKLKKNVGGSGNI